MADPPLDTPTSAVAASERSSIAGMPRWVKASGVSALVMGVLVVLMLTGLIGGAHGPGRHLPPGGIPTSSVQGQGVSRP